MSKHLERIYNVLQNANSKKISDRKECVSSLMHLYENKQIIADICKNSEHKEHIVTWSYIIHTVHKLLISEAERLATKELSNKLEIDRQNMRLLMENTFRHAFNKKSLFSCNDVMPLILQVISGTTYKPYYDTYLKILISYILPLRVHQVNMSPEFWKVLLDILCTCDFKHVTSVISKRAILEALQMSVQYGCLHSNLSLNVSNILSFIESVLPSVVRAQEVLAGSFYKLTNTLCRHIAAEYRIELCHFSETVSSTLSRLQGPIEKYDTLLLFVRIHHPEGVGKDDDRAYADDWTRWYRVLNDMYVSILKDFTASELPRTFVHYAAEVLKQVLENTDLINEGESVNDCNYLKSAKRRRISARINGPVDLLDIYDSEETWPTVQVFTELFKRYPECLKSVDFPVLLKTLLQILTLYCKEENFTDSLYELFAVLLANEKMYVITDVESSNIVWDKIWDIVLRSLNVNQNETSTHTLTQLFVANNKITNPNTVLKLYLTNVIKWSVMSVRTLIVLCDHFPLPADVSVCSINEYSPTMDANSVRSSLIKWLLDIPWQNAATEIVIDELCLSLIGMTLKTKHGNQIRFKDYNVNDQCDCLEDENSESFYKHVEQCYLLLTYEKNLFIDRTPAEKPKAKVNEHILYKQEVVTFLTSNLYNLINETVKDDLHVIITKVAIVAKAISMMKELNLISENIEKLQLVQQMKKYMANTDTLLKQCNPSKNKYSYLYQVMKALCSLYETSYDVQVAEIIVSSATWDMLKNIFNLMNIVDDEFVDYEISINFRKRRKYFNREDAEERCCKYCDKGTIRIQATKTLLSFCCMTVEQKSSHEIQRKLMNYFLKINMYDLSHTVDFKMAVMVLKSLSKYGEERSWKNHSQLPLENLLMLHRTCYKDETSMRYIFSIFPYFFKYSLNHGSCMIGDLMKIISEFNNLRSERYGFVAQIEFVKCLSEIIRISPSHLHYSAANDTLNQVMPVLEGLLSSLTSSSFIVKKETIKWIQSIYSSKSIAFTWKKALFARIEEALVRTIVIEERTNSRISADKKEITTASTLLTFATIASTSGAFQSQALLSMLRFTVEKEIDFEKMLKAISIVTDRVNCSNLIEENLSFLLTYWYNSKYSSRSFPWKLTRCESEAQFFQTYDNTLAFIKFRKLELSEIASICNRANLSFEQVIENIFPEVLVWVLYCIDGNEGNVAKRSAHEIFRKLRSNEDEFSQMKGFSALFNGKFVETLLYLFGRLHDEDHLEEILGTRVSLAISDPPHFNKKAIDNCLKFIVDSYCQDSETLFEYVLLGDGSSILQRVLSKLNGKIHKKEFEEHRIKAFHQYTYFCTLVIEELGRDYFDALSTYVIKDIGYSLLYVIKMYDDVRPLACKYLYDFVKRVSLVRSEQLKEILKFTVAVLVPIVQMGGTSVALDILNFLIIDQEALLSDAIQKLNVFPNIPVFQRIREVHSNLKHKMKRVHTLEGEIQYFLSTMADKDIDCSLEDISHLLIQLSTRKDELRRLYDALEKFRGFSEDCASSLLHQLVYKLIKLTGSAEMDISIEAARCLGELGPIDLMSMILYLEKGHVKESSDLIEILSYKIIMMMVKFLFESDIELRRISADVLYVVFSSFWSRKLLNSTYMNSLKSALGESQISYLEMSYIQPFILANDKNLKTSSIGINETNVNEILDEDNIIWTIQSEDSYSDWIVRATCKVAACFTRFYSGYLIPVCGLSTDFCEMILPRIMYLIIHTDENTTGAMWKCIDKFFEHHFNSNTETNVLSHKSTNCDHRIVRCMLNIVNYIRMQIPSNNLKLNYMHIAKAAHFCSAYFTAVLYAEMSCEAIVDDGGGSDRLASVPKIDRVYQLSPHEGKVIQGILRDSYAKLGDVDAIRGTGSSHLQLYSTRIQHYVHTNEWDRVMLANDVELSFGNTSMIREMANGLHQSGLQYLLGNLISVASRSGEKLDDDILYEHAWRLGNWDILKTNQFIYSQNNSSSKLDITEHDYHSYHYHALKCFHEGNEGGVADAMRNARISVIKALRNTSLESNKTIYKKLTQLQLIREIEDLTFVGENDYGKVLDKWQQQNIANFNDFRYMEPILTQRTVMFQINDTLASNANIKHALFNTYLQLSKMAADKDNLQIATRSLVVLAKQSDLSPKVQDLLLYQEALLARHRNDMDVGRCLLRSLMDKNTLDENLRPQILRVYGDWMAETKSENPQTVIEEYYLKSIYLCMSINEQRNDNEIVKILHDTQVALARFADAQFEQINSYMKSPQFETLKECVTYSWEGIDEQSVPKDRDIRSVMLLNRRQNTKDAAELEHIQKERNNYLILALKYYLKTLQQSESYNLLVFRVIALWLDNVHQKEVNDLLEENMDVIPSFKFIPLVPQLVAHITEDRDHFHVKIYKIMQRCALEHPHHTLPVLLALKNLHSDCDKSSITKRRTPEPRVLGARKLLEELKTSNVHKIILEMERLSRALVSLANLPATSSKPGTTIKIPRNQEILKIKQFENIYVPTLRINVNPSKNYNSVVGVAKYVDTYETVGGINTPKKLVCIGTDGISRNQLIKGKDDLRQDAVMQQVFTVMNTLLRSHEETKRRKLAIRTYKVVPLTQRSGIVEWCDNTSPIASVLIGTDSVSGLHKKYYPRDYTAKQCKEKFAAVAKHAADRKMKVYMDCCEHMHPVMHHFFTEKYPSPETWFERRLAYTRSIATTSMAGFVLGLGDRHLNNILIDQTTAEVIHIDFGIAFEQGKVLPVPETVPFRLTRNIEAGMGVSGVEGTMRHCCEKTLTVLRDQRQIIITLLQVLLYDPLFRWTITPAKAHNIQSGSSSKSDENNQYSKETNKSAERALLRIEQKLQGTEDGLVSSVSGQVERLIQEARDPRNLCRIFYGWQPYL